MSEELWKPIPGYEHYSVSTHGRVRLDEKARSNGKVGLLKIQKSSWGGEPFVQLTKNGKRKGFLLKKLMLNVFVGKRPAEHVGDFLDGDKRNLALSNLKWTSVMEHYHLMEKRKREKRWRNIYTQSKQLNKSR